MSPPNSTVAVAQIPSITELRKELDYGDPHLSRCTYFYDDIRTYRRKYRTSSGLLGSEVVEWKTPEAQSALDEITDAYLDKDGHGHVYWPSDNTSTYRNKLEYSKHQSTIRRLVKQLIFRLNQQQYRNNKYKRKEPSSTDSLLHRGTSTDNPIEVDEMNTDPKVLGTSPAQPQTYLMPPAPMLNPGSSSLFNTASVQSPTSPLAAELNNAGAPTIQTTIPDSVDIYEVPLSYEYSNPAIKPNPKKRQIITSHTVKSKHSSAKRLKTIPQAKHTKEITKSNASQPAGSATWRSPREKKTWRYIDRAPTDELNAALASPSPPRSPPRNSDSDMAKRTESFSANTVIANGDSQIGLNPSTILRTTEADSSESQAIPQETTSTTAIPRSHSPNTPFLNVSSGYTRDVSTPATISVPETSQSTGENIDAPKQTFRGKPKVEVVYLLILSRSPVYECKGWQPNGSFQEMSLVQLLQQLPFDHSIKGLVFTLEGPGVRMEQRIDRDDENGFEVMKRRLNKTIRVSLANRSDTNKSLFFEIEIEPQKDEALASAEEDDTTNFL